MFGLNVKVGKSFFRDAGDKLFVTSLFYTMQGEGPLRGRPALFVRLAKCNLGCSWCLDGETKITMSDGSTKKISDISVGDSVVSWNKSKSKFEDDIVTITYLPRTVESLVRVDYAGKTKQQSLYATNEHEILSNNRGWVKSEELSVGERLISNNPDNPVVTEVKRDIIHYDLNDGDQSNNDKSHLMKVYNFQTQNNHNYIANDIVVHNCDAFFEEGDWLTIDQILDKASEEISKYFNQQPPKWALPDDRNQKSEIAFIVTGGEPTLQNDLLYHLLDKAKLHYKWTQIESNGVLAANVPDETIVVISPKCNEKVDITQGFKRYIPTEYMKPNKKAIARADCLKFIMEDNVDFDSPYATIPDWAFQWKQQTGRDIYVSPMNIYNKEPKKAQEIRAGKNKISLEERSLYDEVVSWWEPGLFNLDANERNHKHTAKYALEHGLIFQVQLHLFAGIA